MEFEPVQLCQLNGPGDEIEDGGGGGWNYSNPDFTSQEIIHNDLNLSSPTFMSSSSTSSSWSTENSSSYFLCSTTAEEDGGAKRCRLDDDLSRYNQDGCLTSSRTSEFSALEKSLRIEIIAEKISVHLSFMDLKSCRLVGRNWVNFATNEMRRRPQSFIFFQWDKKSRDYFRRLQSTFEPALFGRKSLDDLVHLLHGPLSRGFPCTAFKLKGGTLASPSIQKFFSAYGFDVKSLSLYPEDDEEDLEFVPTKSTIKDILLNQTPNVETLTIGPFPLWWMESDRLFLPHLKFLTNACPPGGRKVDYPTAFRMLGHAPKLKAVYNFPLKYLNWFLSNSSTSSSPSSSSSSSLSSRDRVRLIKNWNGTIQLKPTFDLPNLELFANAHPQLISLQVPCPKHASAYVSRVSESEQIRYSVAMTAILESSKETLEILHVNVNAPLGRLKWPSEFKVLKKLKLIAQNYRDLTLPSPLKLDPSTFPQLHSVSLSLLKMSTATDWDLFFPPLSPPNDPAPEIVCNSPWRTVKELELAEFYAPDWSGRLNHFFPAVTSFKILSYPLSRLTTQVGGLIQYICTVYGDQLEDFTIEASRVGSSIANLDSALTGISQEMCDSMTERWSGKVVRPIRSIEDLKKELITPGVKCVRDLKKLKRLRFRIRNGPDDKVCCLMTELSGVYAFALMPQVKVTIAYDQYVDSSEAISDDLKVISPYVEIVHEAADRREDIIPAITV